jgi:hypothetical protein
MSFKLGLTPELPDPKVDDTAVETGFPEKQDTFFIVALFFFV